jgi:hypothetical protein
LKRNNKFFEIQFFSSKVKKYVGKQQIEHSSKSFGLPIFSTARKNKLDNSNFEIKGK